MNFSKLLNIYFIYLFVVWRRWSICKRRLLYVLNAIQFNMTESVKSYRDDFSPLDTELNTWIENNQRHGLATPDENKIKYFNGSTPL